MMKRLLLVLTTIGLGLGLFFVPASSARALESSSNLCTVTPSTVPVGSRFTVSVQGHPTMSVLPANSLVEVIISSHSNTNRHAVWADVTTQTDSAGNLSVDLLAAPNPPLGTNYVRIDQAGATLASCSFTITP